MSVNSKMTALANEIRELSGTTTNKSIDAMTSDVDAANTEITEQTDLIAQITTALEGKTGSSGSIDSTIETCTVTFSSTDGASTTMSLILYTTLDSDGNVVGATVKNQDITGSTVSITCVCNTGISVIANNNTIDFINATSVTSATIGNLLFGYYMLTAQPGEVATFTFS